jgi:hypothetical protein
VVRDELDGSRDFGLLAAWEPEDIAEALGALQAAGKLRLPERGWWKGRLAPARRAALRAAASDAESQPLSVAPSGPFGPSDPDDPTSPAVRTQ